VADPDIGDPYVKGAVKLGHHLRRYQPFYVFGIMWILMAALFPSVNPLNSSSGSGNAYDNVAAGDFAGNGTSGAQAAAGSATATAGTSAAAGTATGAASGGGVVSAGGGAASGSTPAGATSTGGGGGATGSAGSAAPAASGKTVGGFDCAPGGRQIPWSLYAAPCQAASDGKNPGATATGVSDKEIVLVERNFPESANSRAVNAALVQAGFADATVTQAVRNDWWSWFNQVYDLYGRQVKHVQYESENGNSTDEAQSKGKEGACLDADVIAKEIKAFALDDATGGTGPEAECLAERGVVAFAGGAYFPESWYRKYHPYIYNVLMECERISIQTAEYVGKRLANRNAKWALDPLYQNSKRVFGTYVPDNDEYQHCVSLYQGYLKDKYHTDPGPKYDYILDVSRFADEAAKAVVQFKAQGVTSLILACDPISVIFLTQAAESQQWGPEWILIGVAATDTDNFGRLYAQSRVDGHMFGISQLGDIGTLIGPKSESGESYRHIPRDKRTYDEMPEGTNGEYYYVLHDFNGLQLAGPNLSAQSLFDGYCLRYGEAKQLPFGLWRFNTNPDGSAGCDHTAVEDSREVYWSGATNGPDGKAGTFLVTMDGKRFTNGDWPTGDPQVYP
jgi:hypothetical protein